MGQYSRINIANNARTELDASITDTDTSISVVDASVFASAPIQLTLTDGNGNIEIVEVGSVDASNNNLDNVTRGLDGTSAQSWSAGNNVEDRFNAGTYDELVGNQGLESHDHSETDLTKVPNTGLVNSNVTVANTSIPLGGSGTPEADNLGGSNGTSGQVLQTDGNNLSWADVGTPEIVAFETGHTEWATGLSDEEVHRFSNPNGFDLKQLEMQVKGGGTANAELKVMLGYDAPQSLIQTLTDSTDRVSSVGFGDGYLAIGGRDDNVYVYDTSDFSLQETLTDSTSFVNSVGFGDGYLAAGSSNNNVYVYDTTNFTLQETLTDSTSFVNSVGFGDGYLAIGGRDNNVYVYDTSDFSLQETLTDNSSSVNSVVFSLNSDYLAAGGNDDVVYVYDTTNFTLQETLTDTASNIPSIDFSSSYLGVASNDNVYVYDTSDFSLQETITSTDNSVNSVSFSIYGSYLAVGTEYTNNNVYVYDTSDFSLQETLTDSTDRVKSVAFGDGYLAAGSQDNNAYVYDQSVNSVTVSAGNSNSTGYTTDKDPVVIRLTTNEQVDASLIVRGEKK